MTNLPSYNPFDEPDEPDEILPSEGRGRRRLPLLVGLAILAGVAAVPIAVTVSRGGNAKEAATRFMSALDQGRYDDARALLCQDGRRAYDSSDALREAVGIGDREVRSFTIDSATSDTVDGESRTDVRVTVVLSDGDHYVMHLNVTKENGKYAVCGF